MYGYAEQFAHLAQRPQQKFPNYFCLFFLSLCWACDFLFWAKSCLAEFYYRGKDEKDAPQLRNYSFATEILFT